MIALTEVKSKMLQAFGYDATTRTLAVRFGPGKVYQYTDVPPEAAEKLAQAESIGSAFASTIRGKFGHTVVLDEQEETP